MRMQATSAIFVTLVACQPAAELPGGMGQTGDETVATPQPLASFSDEVEIEEVEDPGCVDDLGCLTDETCAVFGGCDANPCTDDRCVEGRCELTDVDECDPGYVVHYSYSACCATRALDVAPDGRLTFQIEGQDPVVYDHIAPAYLQSIVDRASSVGFFGWDRARCVGGETEADFSLYMTDGMGSNTVACQDGVCVGRLCDVIDTVWAIMPSNWHDDCGC